MTPKAAQAKGDRLENYIVSTARSEVDKDAYRIYGSGNGLDKNDVRLPNYNLEIEAKNQKTIHLMDWWNQKKRQETPGNVSVLAIRNPELPEFKETLIVIDYGDFLELLKKQKGEVVVISNKDNALKWAVQRLKDNCQGLLKIINKEN